LLNLNDPLHHHPSQDAERQHFAAGVVLAVPVQALFGSMLITIAVASVVGLGKEAADLWRNK